MTDDNRRTETARENDDSEMIDSAITLGQPSQQGTSGGALAEDVATQAELERVRDPEAHEGVTKEDDIAYDQAYPSGQRGDS